MVRQMNSWMHFLYCCSVGLPPGYWPGWPSGGSASRISSFIRARRNLEETTPQEETRRRQEWELHDIIVGELSAAAGDQSLIHYPKYILVQVFNYLFISWPSRTQTCMKTGCNLHSSYFVIFSINRGWYHYHFLTLYTSLSITYYHCFSTYYYLLYFLLLLWSIDDTTYSYLFFIFSLFTLLYLLYLYICCYVAVEEPSLRNVLVQ